MENYSAGEKLKYVVMINKVRINLYDCDIRRMFADWMTWRMMISFSGEKYKMLRKNKESFACSVGFMVNAGFSYNRKLKIKKIFFTSIKKMALNHWPWTIFNMLSSIRVKTPYL